MLCRGVPIIPAPCLKVLRHLPLSASKITEESLLCIYSRSSGTFPITFMIFCAVKKVAGSHFISMFLKRFPLHLRGGPRSCLDFNHVECVIHKMKRGAIPIWLVFYWCAGICISNVGAVHIFLLARRLHILFDLFFFFQQDGSGATILHGTYRLPLWSPVYASVMLGSFWSALYLCRGIHLHRGCMGRSGAGER